MVCVRERLSDALLSFGTAAAIDRTTMQRSLESARGQRGYHEAAAALAVAAWVDSTVIWLSWRLRPRRIPL